jgi:hypothetical protein
MSKVFDDIKNEVNGFHDESEKKRELANKLLEQRLARDRLILEKSGVR